jgi:hypothetical protein
MTSGILFILGLSLAGGVAAIGFVVRAMGVLAAAEAEAPAVASRNSVARRTTVRH